MTNLAFKKITLLRNSLACYIVIFSEGHRFGPKRITFHGLLEHHTRQGSHFTSAVSGY